MASPAPSVRTGAAPRVIGIAELVRQFQPHERVFLPGSAGEVVALTDALCADDAPPLTITASFIPGINPVPISRLPAHGTFTGMFAQTDQSGAQADGRFRHIALSYGAFTAHLRDNCSFDTCIVQVAPPDRDGRCSLGLAVEFTPIAAAKSKRIVAVINPQMPRLPNAHAIALSDAALVVEQDAPLRLYDVGAPSAQAETIAGHVAGFIGDGAAVQIGLGKIPDALLRRITDRKNLRLHSGMLSDGARALLEAGSLDRNYVHTSCVHVGSLDYYKWLADRSEFTVRGCDYTHCVGVLLAIDNFVAVNSAVSIDLFGQANLEMLDKRMISGIGGSADFARGASLSRGGVSVVALPATSSRGDVSRIVPMLDGICAIPRADVGVVVTEFGAADLRGCSVIERAERIIAVAAPQHRGTLQDAFREMAKRL